MNPFKFGTVVDGEFFTDRTQELEQIRRLLESENHLVLISPRRFGKTSLVLKALGMTDRPAISVNLQKASCTSDFASLILKEIFKLYKWEKIKYEMSHFRVIPIISTSPFSNGVDVSFQTMNDSTAALEDSFKLIEKLSTPENRMIVVLDEFQEIAGLEMGLDKKLRSIMQEQRNLNYIILGSQESMMTEIFERKKSPFYHFGTMMRLSGIPYEDFRKYIIDRLPAREDLDGGEIADEILKLTSCHPYYTQQLSSQVWNILKYELEFGKGEGAESLVAQAALQLTAIHDLDFERVWLGFNATDRRIIQNLCCGRKLSENRSLPTSTVYSAVRRLVKAGYVIKLDEYVLEDPFFKLWVIKNRI